MDISNELIDKLSDLAKLDFTAEEKQNLRGDLEKILDFFNKLSEVDTAGVEPLIFMSDAVNVLRDDEVKQTITHEEALLNAPKRDSSYFRVPKFLEK